MRSLCTCTQTRSETPITCLGAQLKAVKRKQTQIEYFRHPNPRPFHQLSVQLAVRRPNDSLIMADSSKPIAFCEHLQLSSLGVQPGSISFQVRVRVLATYAMASQEGSNIFIFSF